MFGGGEGEGALLGVDGAPKKDGAASLGGSTPATGAGAPKKLGVAAGAADLAWPNSPNVMGGPPGAALDAEGAGGGAPQPSEAGAALVAGASAAFAAAGGAGGAPNPNDGADGLDEGRPRPSPPLFGCLVSPAGGAGGAPNENGDAAGALWAGLGDGGGLAADEAADLSRSSDRVMGGLASGELRTGAVDGKPLPPNMGLDPNIGALDGGGAVGVGMAGLACSAGGGAGVEKNDGLEADEGGAPNSEGEVLAGAGFAGGCPNIPNDGLVGSLTGLAARAGSLLPI